MAKTAAHTRVPHQWTKNEGKKLSPVAFKLYFVFLSFADGKSRYCTVRQSTLAKLTGVSRQYVGKFLDELVDAKLLDYSKDPDNKTGRANTYYVHDPMQIHLRQLM